MTSLTSSEDFEFEAKNLTLLGFVYASIFIKFNKNKFSSILVIFVYMTCTISHFQDGRSFQLNLLVSLLADSHAWNEIYK
jgi:hypothetical protein